MAATVTGARLGNAEFSLVQRYIDQVVEGVLTLGLRPELEHDFSLFAQLRGGVANRWVYPSFDPNVSDLRDNALWVRAIDRNGDTVATSAARIVSTENFYELMRDERIWFDPPPAAAGSRCVLTTIGLPQISGAIGHAGGTWVHPTWRGRGLALLLPHFARALMLRNWAIDHETALIFEDLARSAVPSKQYGYTTIAPIIDGFFPPTGKPERVYFCHISRQEALTSFAAALAPRQAMAAAQ